MTSKIEPWAFAALRVVAGGMLVFHGAQKLFGVLGMERLPAFSQLWFGGVIELVGGALVAIGLFTRPAAFLCSGMLAVAYFQFHWKLHLADLQWLPIVNKGEPAVLYCFVFLFISAHGPGRVSIDSMRGAG
jgi:putative oxidoreductase